MPTGCRAEYDRLEKVLVHEPGSELLTALLWPEASSFEETFDLSSSGRRTSRIPEIFPQTRKITLSPH